jgi:hypothetical protein
MRRLPILRALLAMALGAVVLPVGPARAVVPGLLEVSDPTGLVASDNVTVLGNLPEPGAISARFRDDVLYVSGLDGLSTSGPSGWPPTQAWPPPPIPPSAPCACSRELLPRD